MAQPPVAIVMGSESDWPTMKDAREVLREIGVESHCEVVSAHRTPSHMFVFAQAAIERGFKVLIAGAGGAAHLPGMIASLTPLPVIGVPIETRLSGGLDSLLSIVQMPRGVPVATVAIGNALNAGLLAARILSVTDAGLRSRLQQYADEQASKALLSELS